MKEMYVILIVDEHDHCSKRKSFNWTLYSLLKTYLAQLFHWNHTTFDTTFPLYEKAIELKAYRIF